MWLQVQDVPDVLVGTLKAAEADTDAKQALATPQVAGSDGNIAHLQRLAAEHGHSYRLLHVGLQQVLQCLVVPVQPRVSN